MAKKNNRFDFGDNPTLDQGIFETIHYTCKIGSIWTFFAYDSTNNTLLLIVV